MTPVRQCIVLVWLHFPLDKVITSFHWRSVAGKAAQDGYETGEQVWKGKKSPPRKRVMLQLQLDLWVLTLGVLYGRIPCLTAPEAAYIWGTL